MIPASNGEPDWLATRSQERQAALAVRRCGRPCITDADAVPQDDGERTAWTFSQRGILGLTHDRGTEEDAGFKYHDGNAQPQGFGHICFSVPDLAAAISWFDTGEVTYVKRPEQGKMRNVAFIKDRDG